MLIQGVIRNKKIGLEVDIFIQVYINIQKRKFNLALVVKDENNKCRRCKA